MRCDVVPDAVADGGDAAEVFKETVGDPQEPRRLYRIGGLPAFGGEAGLVRLAGIAYEFVGVYVKLEKLSDEGEERHVGRG